MKKMLCLLLVLPFTAFANLDGVYQGKFERNGYTCEFNADIIQEKENSIILKKWQTNCTLNNEQGPKTNINGPLSFNLLKNNQVEVTVGDDVSIYQMKKGSLSENAFNLNYSFDSYLDGEVLTYDISINLKLSHGILNYSLQYTQNDQLIFSDKGQGKKRL